MKLTCNDCKVTFDALNSVEDMVGEATKRMSEEQIKSSQLRGDLAIVCDQCYGHHQIMAALKQKWEQQ